MRRVVLLTALAAALLAAGQPAASLAQAPASAPTAAPARQTYPYIGVYGFSPALKPGGTFVSGSLEPTLLRRAEPDGDIRDWMSESDPSVAALKTINDGGGVAFEIQIDAKGRATGCKIAHQYGPAAFVDGLCDRILPRVRMKPAIDTTGAPAPDAFTYSLFFGRRYEASERLVSIQYPPPAPMPQDRWPPWSTKTPVVITKLDTLQGGPTAPEATGTPWAGLIYNPGDARTPCRVIASSGDADFNKRACDVARKGKYDVSKATSVFQQRVYLHFVLQKGKPRALVPVSDQMQRPTVMPDSLAAMQQALAALPAGAMAKLKLHVSTDKAGAVSGCMILESTGTDAADVLACETVRRLGRFTPARDVFGRPQDGALYRWSPAPKAG